MSPEERGKFLEQDTVSVNFEVLCLHLFLQLVLTCGDIFRILGQLTSKVRLKGRRRHQIGTRKSTCISSLSFITKAVCTSSVRTHSRPLHAAIMSSFRFHEMILTIQMGARLHRRATATRPRTVCLRYERKKPKLSCRLWFNQVIDD